MRSSDLPKLALLLGLSVAATLFFGAILCGWSLRCLSVSDALLVSGIFAASVVLFCFLFGLVTRDCSWVDRLWSILPVIYAWYFAIRSWPDARTIILAILISLWGGRLTYNFARKDGYSGAEDYRWNVLRKKIPGRFFWELFNLFFISLYQNAVIFLFVTPVYLASLHPDRTLGLPDLFFTVLFLGLLAFETIADQQQWEFHLKKNAARSSGSSFDPFLKTGLFRFSRHPNYFAEVGQWWVVYLFGIWASGQPLNLTLAGPVLLTLLFAGSTRFTESITGGKYPEYRDYQKTTSAVIPWFPKKA
jgi:steroid 5-alpha reductase family enzyme